MINSFRIVGLVGVAIVTASVHSGAQLPSEQPQKTRLLIEARVGPGTFVPLGAESGTLNKNVASASKTRGQTLTVLVTNTSGRPLEDVKVEFGLYKVTSKGSIRSGLRGKEKMQLQPLERQLVAKKIEIDQASGEQFYGWYVKISSGDEQVFEKFSPQSLKERQEAQKK